MQRYVPATHPTRGRSRRPDRGSGLSDPPRPACDHPTETAGTESTEESNRTCCPPFSLVGKFASLSEFDGYVADRCTDTDLNARTGFGIEVTRAHVTCASGVPDRRTGMADSHATAVFRRESGILGLFEDCGPRVGCNDSRCGERHRAGRVVGVDDVRGRREYFGVQQIRDPASA